jgi:hypothetical protein
MKFYLCSDKCHGEIHYRKKKIGVGETLRNNSRKRAGDFTAFFRVRLVESSSIWSL